ncbi:MAG: alpha-isopropylmalate synthase regulatory domain-containing protein, partial [Alphaproteobacteria bacterium]
VAVEKLADLTRLSRLLDETINRAPNRHQAYVGQSAFAHKGGLHASAVEKDPTTYEHVPPESVGNKRTILVSNQAGRANILSRLASIGVEVDAKDKRINRLLEVLKEKEHAGYAYEGADASFELLARRALGEVPSYFEVEKYKVEVERRYDARGTLKTVSEATVKMKVDGQAIHSVAEGMHGPVNALDIALRKDLGKYSDHISDVDLVDFKVRIIQTDGAEGTASVTRVLLESLDGAGHRWSTVGVSDNIVDASFQALIDSITYKLYRDKAPA